jgi:inhibitor of cysteine peptidase
VILTRERSGETVALRRGEEVSLSLPESPTTGYRWVFVTDALHIAGDTFAGPAEGEAGGGGTRTVRLVATRAGAAKVGATLRRSWEDAARAVDRCEFHFTVS